MRPPPPTSTLFPYTTLFRSYYHSPELLGGFWLVNDKARVHRARAWSCLDCSGLLHRPHRSEEHSSELQSHSDLVCRLLLEKKKKSNKQASQSQVYITYDILK